jgi:chromosome partitioning protein
MEAARKPNLFWVFIKKVASPVVLITVAVLALKQIPGVLDFLQWAFANAGTNGQVVIIVIAAVGLIYFAIVSTKREERIAELKAERDLLEERLRLKEAELKQVEENNIRLAEVVVKEDIWRRDVVGVPRFVDKEQRNARFISLLNLKGGVGKTTLAANLGVCLALMERPLRVLVIDLDFQATLSNMSVEAGTLLMAGQSGNTSSRLLDRRLLVDDFVKLVVGINRVPNGRIIIADVTLERVDFETQARFFLDPKNDVRFNFRSILHQREVTDKFDVVLLDCPPRLTTSTVNALTSSDYVLIPTKLDERSFEAIPRTVSFINNLRTIAQPKIIGVLANEVQYWRRPTLIKAHQKGMARLKELVKASDPDLYVFEAMVELSTDVAFNEEKNLVPSAVERVRKALFQPVAAELRRRIGKLVFLVQNGPTPARFPHRKRAHLQCPPVNWFTSCAAGPSSQEVEDGQGGRVRTHSPRPSRRPYEHPRTGPTLSSFPPQDPPDPCPARAHALSPSGPALRRRSLQVPH